MIGVQIQDFQELKPKPETSEQNLYVGRGQVGDEAQIWWKIVESVKILKLIEKKKNIHKELNMLCEDIYKNKDLTNIVAVLPFGNVWY